MGQSCSQNCSNLGSLATGGCLAGSSSSGLQGSSGASAPRQLAAPLRGGRREEEAEESPPVHHTAFQISVLLNEEQSSTSVRQGWRSAYALGKLLGDGISAKVYEGEALTSEGLAASVGSGAMREPGGLLAATCSGVNLPRCFRERGRRVALKRFHRVGTRTFQKELWALRRVGVHRHILRLLESYQGHGGEDVLVLEYCDGATLYDLYAREHPNGGLPERLVAKFVRQLLLALEHLALCGIEHQDVKPENMMLYDVSVAATHGELKLGDFGWAAILPTPVSEGGSPAAAEAAAKLSKLPATGAGSLWYAPPELNPPVPGVTQEGSAPAVSVRGEPLRGRSDMWSVGVVLYLLLVGHNPFNVALKQASQEAVDAEVMRLAAMGKFNKSADKWKQLHVDASDFISVLLRVKPSARPSAAEGLRHPFLLRRTAKSSDPSVFFNGGPLVTATADKDRAWESLDGLQRTAWVAIARAVAEPELDRAIVDGAAEARLQAPDVPGVVSCGPQAAYLLHLARELASTPVLQWLQERPAWADVVRLAFCYLDIDGDGLLSAQDLVVHLSPTEDSTAPSRDETMCQELCWAGKGEHPESRQDHTGLSSSYALCLCSRWVARWQDPDNPPSTTARGTPGLTVTSFREALLASYVSDGPLFGGAFDAPPSGRGGRPGSGEPSPTSSGRLRRKPTGHDEEEISWTDMVLQGGSLA